MDIVVGGSVDDDVYSSENYARIYAYRGDGSVIPGWPIDIDGSLKSTPAAYFTGLLIGKEIIKNKKETPIVDFGMLRILSRSKVHAFLKGLVDSGIKIKYKKENFPNEDRISGKHLKKDFSGFFNEIKSKIEKE